jgi:hypothetical protein
MSAVAAVVAGSPRAPLAQQTLPPLAVFAGADGLARAISSEAAWLWLIEGGGSPHADALERLCGASAIAGEPPAAVVSGIVRNPEGVPLESELPAVGHLDVGAVVRLAERRVAPIRHATFANCLVERSAFLRHGMPDPRFGRYAAVEWTARVLRDRAGRFCPASVVIRDSGVAPCEEASRFAEAAATMRMVRSGAWTRGESARELLALAARGG